MPTSERRRPSESALVESVRLLEFADAGVMPMTPDGFWDVAIFKRRDGVTVLRTGLTTRRVAVPYEAGDEILVISFRPSVFMPLMPGEVMRDRGVALETFGGRRFRLGSDIFDIPDFENADVFANRLARSGVVENNDIVASIIDGHPKAMSERTLQRHFLRTTGLTWKRYSLIQRAQAAVDLLRSGRPAVDVALSVGYADQAHMINSLRAIMGRTPGQIARGASP